MGNYYFNNLVTELTAGLAAFYADLNTSQRAYTDRITVVVMSEFGRRLDANADDGTDHGHGSIMMVLGEEPSAEVAARMALLKELTGRDIAPPAVEPLEHRDWVADLQALFPPLSIGRYFVHGSHHAQAMPEGAIPLLIDAGVAFGTGEHGTTSGCLLAFEWLKKRGVEPKRMLDMGCGTAILAIGMAKTWNAPVLAVDLDPVAVKVARENIALNRVKQQVYAMAGDGYKAREVAQHGPYELIVANILARPLMRFAKDLKKHLAPGGYAVLSGLLTHQERMVLSAHALQGLRLVKSIRRGEWSSLIIR